MNTHTQCISMHAQGFILFLESALPLSSGTWAMGNHGPFHRTMAIQTLEMTLGFCPFENQECNAWLLDVHAASLPWAGGMLLEKPVKVCKRKDTCEGDLCFAYRQISFDFYYPLCLTLSHTLKPKAKKNFYLFI